MEARSAFALAKVRSKNLSDRDVKAVVEYATRKIALAATLGHTDTICDFIAVPEFAQECFSRKLAEMAGAELVKAGYYVAILGPSTIYISWEMSA